MKERLIVFVVSAPLAAFTVSMGCTRTVTVPTNEYKSLDDSKARVWRVKTTEQKLYPVTQFSHRDSALVVESIKIVSGDGPDGTPYENLDDTELPMAIPYVEITSIDGVAVPREESLIFWSAVIGIAAIAAFYGIAYATSVR